MKAIECHDVSISSYVRVNARPISGQGDVVALKEQIEKLKVELGASNVGARRGASFPCKSSPILWRNCIADEVEALQLENEKLTAMHKQSEENHTESRIRLEEELASAKAELHVVQEGKKSEVWPILQLFVLL